MDEGEFFLKLNETCSYDILKDLSFYRYPMVTQFFEMERLRDKLNTLSKCSNAALLHVTHFPFSLSLGL